MKLTHKGCWLCFFILRSALWHPLHDVQSESVQQGRGGRVLRAGYTRNPRWECWTQTGLIRLCNAWYVCGVFVNRNANTRLCFSVLIKHVSQYLFAAFNFKLDSVSSHQNLKVEDLSVEWDSSGGKIQDIRKEKNRTNSPMHSPARFVWMWTLNLGFGC